MNDVDMFDGLGDFEISVIPAFLVRLRWYCARLVIFMWVWNVTGLLW